MANKQINLEEQVNGSTLYHYTKSNGINGILNNNCFFATKSDYLNDPREFSFINKIIRRVVKEKIKDEALANMFIADIRAEGYEAGDKSGEYFVLSFSCCRDSITMWAEFGKSNGYNIGFDSAKIIERIEESNSVDYHGMVIYDPDMQKTLIDKLLSKQLPEQVGKPFDEIIREGAKDRDSDVYRKACKKFRKSAAVYAMFFKDAAFSQEEEYRFVFQKDKDTKVNFRVKDGYIIPYIQVALSSKTLPVTEIVVAPSNHIDLAKNGVEYMMKTLGYDVPVELSDIKLRY